MEKIIGKFIGFAIFATFLIGTWTVIMWGLWSLWGWVLPQVYEGGPKNIVAPGFWLFAGCWTLVAMVGRAVFGRNSK